eukprot:m.192270 g.192270  ORF g.192270 m.192270 type:complete len:261 (-) comp13651_c1_seq6:3573-4355(-)
MRGESRYQSRDGDSEYLRLCSSITSNIQFINSSGRSIQRLASSIGTNREPRNALQQLKKNTTETKEKIKGTRVMIDKIGRMDGGHQSEAKKRKQEQKRFGGDLEKAISTFEKGIALAVEKEKSVVSAESSYDDDYGNEHSSLMEDERRQQEQMFQQDVNVRTSYIRERQEGIQQLESDMKEVHEIFTDVADLVQDQGRTLESIEGNMTVAHDRTTDGVQQLTKASRHQKSARKKSLWLLLIVVIAAGVLAAIIVPSLKHK